MTTTSTSEIDLAYRPVSYFWGHENKIKLSSDIKGAERKALYEGLLELDCIELAVGMIKDSALSEHDRTLWGQIHPAFMGGEYLPDCTENEVEIARITIASSTQDVTCVYAKRGKNRIYYRVVDEYNGDTLIKHQRSSSKPLTLEQLTDFFVSSWDLFECLEFNFSGDDYPRDRVHQFIVDASSSFYAEFGQYIRQRINDWLDDKIAGLELDDDD